MAFFRPTNFSIMVLFAHLAQNTRKDIIIFGYGSNSAPLGPGTGVVDGVGLLESVYEPGKGPFAGALVAAGADYVYRLGPAEPFQKQV